MEKVKNIFIKIFPYLVLLIFSVFACYLLFITNGYPNGDDSDYHFANIYDQYQALLEGNFSLISPYLASGVGVGKKLFYSPIPHLVAALMGVILSIFNISLLTSFKVVLFLSVYISGIFMYRFGMHITKNRKVISIICAAIFIFYPYRLFDYYCRIAYAEGLAIMFLPLFYMGLYDILNNKEESIVPYIEVISGAVLLFLSHNLTALYCYIFGIIYLLFNIKKVIALLKNKRKIIYSFLSIGLILGLTLFNIVTQMTLLGMDFYNVSEPVRMWTNVEAVKSRTYDCFSYSGFLNYGWLTGGFGYIFSNDNLTMSLILFIIYSGVAISLDLGLSNIKKLKYFHSIISLTLYFLLICLTINRLEIILGGIIVFILYLIINYSKEEVNGEKLITNIDFWYYIFISIIVLMMITQDYVWDIMPEFLLKIQFPWRLWAFISLFVSILFVYILNSFKEKYAKYMIAVLTGFIMMANQPLLEKRLILQETENPSYRYEITDDVYNHFMSIGANLEYYPKNFYLGSGYNSLYNNSLYYNIYHEIWYSFNKNPYSFEPVFLEGEGNIEVLNKKAPVYEMNIKVEKESLIQLPLLYYPGYEVYVSSYVNSEYVEVIEIDGLVSFRVKPGEYKVITNYSGTNGMKFSMGLRYLSYAGLFIFICYEFIINNKKRINKGIYFNN